ncbi:MAG: hypothetical protein ISQ13_01155 [Candidatus Margulisbacteria bacterium]|nr:hypothetical protein [Candidatus Margulisiibacteriota bacterium]
MTTRLTVFLLMILCSTWLAAAVATDQTRQLLVQATLNSHSLTKGNIELTIGIYKETDDNEPLFSEHFKSIPISNGHITVSLGTNPENPIESSVFEDDNLRIGFKVGNSEDLEFIELSAVPYAFHSEVSDAAQRLQNEELMKFDFINNRIGVNNTSPQTTLDVGGTVKATAFSGDGSQLTNLSISDDRLVWLKNSETPTNIYYTNGNVGISTETPGATLDILGNAIVSGNLTVRGLLQADQLKGDGSGITNINASQINAGVINAKHVVGDYPGITGVGILTSGTWNATEIADQYIANQLTLNDATISGTNTISGEFSLTGHSSISGDHKFSISSKGWAITPTGGLTVQSVTLNTNILISNNAIEVLGSNGLELSPPDTPGLYISPTGSVGVNTITPASEFHVNGGITLGFSPNGQPGMIRFNPEDNTFEGYRNDTSGNGTWIQLDYNSSFDSHALHAEGDAIKNLIYINSDGHVGIGGIPDDEITDHLVVSGNVVFKGSSIIHSSNDLNIKGAGTRMMWVPKKAAFRSGYVEGTQWDYDTIGEHSVVFGNSGNASGDNTVIVGGINSTNSGDGSVVVGGINNHIDSSSYSVIVGGGSAIAGEENQILNSTLSTIVGGKNNKITNAIQSTIIGGGDNTVNGNYSVAMGKNITINHNSSFVFSDGIAPRETGANNQFLIFASGGVGIGQAPEPGYDLSVAGGIKAMFFEGDGSGLTDISASRLGGFAAETTASRNSIYISDDNGFLPADTVSGLSIIDGSITGNDIQANSITGDKIERFSITGDKIESGTISSDQIADNSITADKIQPKAISGEHIQAESITKENIAPNAIQTHHIADGQVTNGKIAPDTIDSSRIADQSITSQDIGLKAISSINIADDAIQARHIAYATVVSDNIAEDAIQAQHINDLVVSSRVIQDNAILTNHIKDNAILQRHIADNAIQGIHIADAVIINERIKDNSIESNKIAPNAILGIHLPDNVIISRHIADRTILEQHISDVAIGEDKIDDNAIVSRNIQNGAVTSDKLAPNSVESIHILDGTITSKDIQEMGFLPNEMIAEGAIASINIADNAIGGNHIKDGQIESLHILDFSIVSRDIKDETIDATRVLANGTITAELIAENAIQEHHLADNSVTSRNLADASIPWEKITMDPIPEASIADLSIPGSKIKDGSIPGSKIEPNSITSDKLADNSISTNALIGTLSVEKGGTGLTQNQIDLLKGSVLYASGEPARMAGNKNHISWDEVNMRMGINTAAPEAALHVDGSLLTTQGVFFGNMENSISFGVDGDGESFIIIGPESPAQLNTDGESEESGNVEPLGTLKTSQLYVKEKVGIGISDPVNALDVKGTMAIGQTFAGVQAPANGLIVEGNVGIGTTTPAHALDVNGAIQAKSIIGKSESDSTPGIGIQGIGGEIGIKSVGSKVGIEVDAKEQGIVVTSEGSEGVGVLIKNASNSSAIGVQAIIKNSSGQNLVTGELAKRTSDYSAGVYGWARSQVGANHWAGYFDGPVHISGNLGLGEFLTGDLPDAPLHVKGTSLFESTVHVMNEGTSDDLGTSIDWSSGSVQTHTCNDDSTISFIDSELTQGGVYILTLILNAQSGCSIGNTTFSGIKWAQGQTTVRHVENGDTIIYSFFLDKTTNTPVYYGIDVGYSSGGG